MSVLATDNFTGTNGTTPTSANWATITGLGGIQIQTNQARSVSTGNTGQVYNNVSAPDDQYAKCTLTAVNVSAADEGGGPACRIAAGAQTFYFGQGNSTDTRLYKAVATVFTQLGTTQAGCAANDVLELDCVGTTITLKKNGTTIVSVTDSAIASGNAGIWIADASGGGPTTFLDTWEMGDFSSGGVDLSVSTIGEPVVGGSTF